MLSFTRRYSDFLVHLDLSHNNTRQNDFRQNFVYLLHNSYGIMVSLKTVKVQHPLPTAEQSKRLI